MKFDWRIIISRLIWETLIQVQVKCKSQGEVIMSAEISGYEKQLILEIKETPTEYLPNLLQIVRLFRDSVVLKPAEDCFKQGWKEAMAGETCPVSELWDGIDAE